MRRTEYNDGWVAAGDCLDLMSQMEEQSVDLVFGSPPYEKARLYLEGGVDLGIARDTEEWVAWMVEVFRASLHVSRGLVAFVVGHGQTENFRWSGAPALLCADLIRAGITLRNPLAYRRNGIMGSGGPDWLRADYEWIVCATNGGKLPWSDNTALGTKPKFQPGGPPSHRGKDGGRRNGHPVKVKKTNRAADKQWSGDETQYYVAPEKTNPGNVIDCGAVGGGNIGSNIAHENEAPFPLQLAEFFVRSFCPPGGTVCDPFSGSGTTAHAAIRWGRKFAAMDLRPSQIELIKRRVRQARLEGKQLI